MNAPLDPGALARPASVPDGPERDAVFTTSSQAPVAALTEAVLSGLRVVALTGEPSASRSAIVNAFAIGLVEAGVGVVRIRNGAPGPLGVSRLVALVVGASYAGGGHGVEDDLQHVVNVLTAPTYRGKRLVLLIEDAENLDRPALAMLRLLPGLPRGDSPCAQLMLVGRSGLWTLLASPPRAPPDKDVTAPASTPAVETVSGPMQDSVADDWSSLLSSFEPRARDRLRRIQAGPVAGNRPVRSLLASLVAVAVLAAGFLAYHSFYRGLPFRPPYQPPHAPTGYPAPPQPPPPTNPARPPLHPLRGQAHTPQQPRWPRRTETRRPVPVRRRLSCLDSSSHHRKGSGKTLTPSC